MFGHNIHSEKRKIKQILFYTWKYSNFCLSVSLMSNYQINATNYIQYIHASMFSLLLSTFNIDMLRLLLRHYLYG